MLLHLVNGCSQKIHEILHMLTLFQGHMFHSLGDRGMRKCKGGTYSINAICRFSFSLVKGLLFKRCKTLHVHRKKRQRSSYGFAPTRSSEAMHWSLLQEKSSTLKYMPPPPPPPPQVWFHFTRPFNFLAVLWRQHLCQFCQPNCVHIKLGYAYCTLEPGFRRGDICMPKYVQKLGYICSWSCGINLAPRWNYDWQHWSMCICTWITSRW